MSKTPIKSFNGHPLVAETTGTVDVDTTLTQEGMAADAKAAGDAIAANAGAIAQLSEEIADIQDSVAAEKFLVSGNIVRCTPLVATDVNVKTDAGVTVFSCGRNLVGTSAANTGTKVRQGVSFTFEEDGSVTLNGAVEGNAFFPVLWDAYNGDIFVGPGDNGTANPFRLPPAKYRWSGFATGSAENAASLVPIIGAIKPDGTVYNYNPAYYGGDYVTFADGEIVGVNHVHMACPAGAVYTNYNVKWQLEVGNIQSDYEPHVDVRQVESDGEVNISGLIGEYTIWASSGKVTASGFKDKATSGTAAIVNAKNFDIPVLTLDGDCTGMTKENAVPLAYTFQGMRGTLDCKWQGSSSVVIGEEIGKEFDNDVGGLFNFTLKFPTAFEAKEGWGEQTKYVFKANAVDQSQLLNICSCILAGEVTKCRANVPDVLSSLPNGGAVDGFPCAIVLNGKFYAVGTFNIPKDGWMFGSPKAIVCADWDSQATRFKGTLTTLDAFELEYVEDENDQDWVLPSVNRAIQSVIDSNGSDLDTTVAQYIDIPSAIDYYNQCANECAWDCIHRNYILVSFDKVKWYFGTYDRDNTYGNNTLSDVKFTAPNVGATYEDIASDHRLMELIYNHKRGALKARAIELRNGVMSEYNVTKVFTDFAAGFPAALIAANFERWPKLQGTNVANLARILNWYRLRRAYLDPIIDSWS